jgi:hypothetical protein
LVSSAALSAAQIVHLDLEMGQHKAPRYVLISSSSRTQLTAVTGPTTSVLGHPVLQYHYANDNPLSLFHISPNEQVLLDYNSPNPAFTHAKTRCARKVSVVVLTVHSTSLQYSPPWLWLRLLPSMLLYRYLLHTRTSERLRGGTGWFYGRTGNELCMNKFGDGIYDEIKKVP